MTDIRMNVNSEIQVSYQSTALSRTVAERMQAYRERMAAKIKAEMDRRAEDPVDLGYAIGVRDRTVERWIAGISEPRRKNVKAMAEHWKIELSELQPDLEAEERQLQDQLNRIEKLLEEIRDALLSQSADAALAEAERLTAEQAEAARTDQREADETSEDTDASSG